VDDFSSQVLIDCQRAAILEPDVVLVVSQVWRQILENDYGVQAEVIPNGVDMARFSTPDRGRAARLRERAGAAQRPLILAVGGIEPRKGSDTLVRALAEMKARRAIAPVLAVIGGHSFQDHRAYRDRVLALLPELGLGLDDDVVLVGTVPDSDIPPWYAAADVLAFPSVKEGFGLAVLEAMSARVPVVTSDLPVFREYLVSGRDALLIEPGDVGGLAAALLSTMEDAALRQSLVEAGSTVAARFTWQESAQQHLAVYAEVGRGRRSTGAMTH
jgi:glycosyltransferase involved in cell wall biosynthesis